MGQVEIMIGLCWANCDFGSKESIDTNGDTSDELWEVSVVEYKYY